ncbi:sensor histidine kinase [Sunxiuqinia sp. A32]|uniref:sensor histidine kinase n=1 Tax=Sunxiuqinia sp. A32 TaxID=3461496 RepID=UPI004045FB71
MKILENTCKKQTLATRLPNYSPLSIIIRVTIISMIAILIIKLIVFATGGLPENVDHVKPGYYILVIVIFNFISEFQIALDNILEKFLPIPNRIKLRIAIQFSFGILMLVVCHRFAMSVIEPTMLTENSRPSVYMGLILGLLFANMLSNSLAIARFTGKWVETQEQISKMKQEKLKMDYNSLQDQINPHFLFNNLSVLKSLIIYDKDAALKFTENFTDVYRYVLQSKDKMLTTLRNEKDFIESYIGLHKERLGEGFQVKLLLDDESLDREIAPLTLQLLTENAIKHNIISKESPLKLEINTDNEYLIVKNNLQPRTSSYSTKTGLSNLINRYEMLTPSKIEVSDSNETFMVKVPML